MGIVFGVNRDPRRSDIAPDALSGAVSDAVSDTVSDALIHYILSVPPVYTQGV